MILRLGMGMGLLLAIVVMYPDMKIALEAVIATMTVADSNFAELIRTSMPYWVPAAIVACVIAYIVGGRRGGV